MRLGRRAACIAAALLLACAWAAPLRAAEAAGPVILTANQATYSITSALVKGTSIQVRNLPADGREMALLQDYISRRMDSLTPVFSAATAVVTLTNALPEDPLYRFARQANIRIVNIDADNRVVGFQEKQRPTLVGTRVGEARVGDVVTSGRFWIEAGSGTVWRSQIKVEEEFATGTFDVVYGAAPGFDVPVPVSMEEIVSVRAGDRRLERGLATAGDIRPVE